MPDWTVRRRLPGTHREWCILADPPGNTFHPFWCEGQDAVKWQNHVYAVTMRGGGYLMYVPVPLPPGTVLGQMSESSDSDY
jgi:hypothetical protein